MAYMRLEEFNFAIFVLYNQNVAFYRHPGIHMVNIIVNDGGVIHV